MGWENKFHCEWNEFGQKVLKYYWPEAESFGDITKTDFKKYNGSIDIISGGFPCQPYSQAGKRKGNEDDRHLWPEMLRAIREVQPFWVVGENVPGLINWKGGMVLKEIKTDLESEGFKVLPPLIIPACGKDAPHRRDRLWIIAHSKNKDGRLFIRKKKEYSKFRINGNNEIITNPEIKRLQEWDGKQTRNCSYSTTERHCGLYQWENFPTESPIRSRNDGVSKKLDGLTFSKHRNESIRAYGNSIVPQVAYQIFKTIEQYENLNNG